VFLFPVPSVCSYINWIYTVYYLHTNVIYILNDDDYNIFTYYLCAYISIYLYIKCYRNIVKFISWDVNIFFFKCHWKGGRPKTLIQVPYIKNYEWNRFIMVHLIYYIIIIIIIYERLNPRSRRNVVWGPRCIVRGCGFVWTLGHSKIIYTVTLHFSIPH